MLLEFKTTNYKSFKDEMIFSLEPAPKQKGLDYSILKQKIGKKNYKALCSSVIYGANASGKTNIIGAMDTFKNIVLRGNIRNNPEKNNINTAASFLELIPNNTLSESRPVDFSIKFIEKELLIEYGFSMDVGKFLDNNYAREIKKEFLKVNEKVLFERKGKNLNIGKLDLDPRYFVNAFEENAASAIELAKNNLHDEELFLTNGFKMMFSAKLVELILDWFQKKLTVIYRSDALKHVLKSNNTDRQSVYIEDNTNEVAKLFGINSNAVGYVMDEETQELRLCSVFKNKNLSNAIPAEIFESYGTLRFINMFPLIADKILSGGVLVIDEFDASIHPAALMNIISIFHNDELNTNQAQLIFNTHNPIFLNANIFRRDEIKFVERDDDDHYSTHYSLSDFGTAGEKGVRQGEDYMKNYFVSRYGAIKEVDLAPVFEKLKEV